MSGTEPGSGLAVALGATDKLGANGEVAVEVGGGGGDGQQGEQQLLLQCHWSIKAHTVLSLVSCQ